MKFCLLFTSEGFFLVTIHLMKISLLVVESLLVTLGSLLLTGPAKFSQCQSTLQYNNLWNPYCTYADETDESKFRPNWSSQYTDRNTITDDLHDEFPTRWNSSINRWIHTRYNPLVHDEITQGWNLLLYKTYEIYRWKLETTSRIQISGYFKYCLLGSNFKNCHRPEGCHRNSDRHRSFFLYTSVWLKKFVFCQFVTTHHKHWKSRQCLGDSLPFV